MAYVTLTLLAVVANGFSATLDFARYKQVVVVMERGRVPLSWMTPLGVLKAAGALGLLAGFGYPPLGVAAAAGLVLFFVAAFVAHFRVRDFALGLHHLYLAISVAALLVQIQAAT
ncbi:DoxX family protein [Hamadaea sp.]|uniref:DoxX family protein n=1 Tax=Hamadaea sp. TaxID=2024425 RepID=UPI0025BBB2F0|nr:DoxX family protein [Hamadaea sp.]